MKFKGYQDYQQKRTLRDNIEDLTPYHITLPDPPKPEEFINFGKPIEEQFFVYEEIPSWVLKLDQQSRLKGKREDIIELCRGNDEYADFIEGQWRKRNEGIFIYIYGQPLYIPGHYWWRLNYYHHEGNKMEFRYVDLDHAWWWKFCVVDNPTMLGGIEMTMRRDGKSARMGSTALEEATRKANFNTGIQSKEFDSAQEFFSKCIVNPYFRIPFYFRPFSDSRTIAPHTLNFRNPEDLTRGLSNWMEIRASNETAFDGTKLGAYILEEPGKCEEMNVDDALKVHLQCLQVRGQKVGHALLSTTVEETSRNGLEAFEKIWAKSDHAKLKQNGRTESGLCRYYKPAYETYRIDQYGMSVIDDPKPYQYEWFKKMNYLEPEKGGRQLVNELIESCAEKDRQDMIRKYSRSIREAFRRDSKNCEFDIIKIDKQLDKYRFLDESVIGGNPDLIYGDLDWENHIPDTKVIFTEKPNGKFAFCRRLFPYLLKRANNVDWSSGIPRPLNKHLGDIGGDPYKYDNTEGTKKSLGTLVGYIGLNLEIEDEAAKDDIDVQVTDNFFVVYGHRHKDKTLYGEDAIKLCHFTGMPLFPEINVPSLFDHFKVRKYLQFLKYRHTYKKVVVDGTTRMVSSLSANAGMQTVGESIKTSLFDGVNEYIEKHISRCYFPVLLEDFRDVQFSKLSPYDYFIAASFAKYANNDSKIKSTSNKKNTEKSYSNILIGF